MVIRTNREFFHLATAIEQSEVKIKYAWRIFDMLDGLRPGDRVTIDDIVKERTKLYFMNIVCVYLFLKTDRKIYFSDDWREVYKDK